MSHQIYSIKGLGGHFPTQNLVLPVTVTMCSICIHLQLELLLPSDNSTYSAWVTFGDSYVKYFTTLPWLPVSIYLRKVIPPHLVMHRYKYTRQ